MMNSKEDNALEYFRSGLNCAQSVLKACTENLQIDQNLIAGISCGFGGGMGRLQETCGAVTGAFMAIGLINDKTGFSTNAELKEKTYSMVQNFSDKFKSMNGATDCRTLLNCNLNTAEGRKYAHDHHLFENICEKCIRDSIKIVEEITG